MFSSPRLLLRPLTGREAGELLAEDAGVRFVADYPSAFAAEVLRLVALYPATDHAGAGELGPWLVLRRPDEAVLGTVSCARLPDPSAVTVGYDIAPSCWGQGYATEALGAVLEHLFGLPAIWRVCAETDVSHVASRRVMEKAGLRWQRDETAIQDGDEVKLAHYAIDRPAPL